MLDALTNKLLHAPTVALREAATGADGDGVLRAARALFALDADAGGGRPELTAVRGHGAAKTKAGTGR
jgi:hypothetical protein